MTRFLPICAPGLEVLSESVGRSVKRRLKVVGERFLQERSSVLHLLGVWKLRVCSSRGHADGGQNLNLQLGLLGRAHFRMCWCVPLSWSDSIRPSWSWSTAGAAACSHTLSVWVNVTHRCIHVFYCITPIKTPVWFSVLTDNGSYCPPTRDNVLSSPNPCLWLWSLKVNLKLYVE